MAGRSLMVAATLGIVALAASAGCAGTHLSTQAEAQTVQSVYEAGAPASASPDSALAMALATQQAAEGPTPVMNVGATDDFPLRGFTEVAGPPEQAFSLNMRQTPYSASSALMPSPGADSYRPMEMSVSSESPFGLDFSLTQRAGSVQDASGATQSRGAEVRVGQRLKSLGVAKEFQSPTSWEKPAWYIFAGGDGQALTYTPSNDPSQVNRNFRMQDRVDIGDIQAGVSVEAGGMQASLSYVKREVTTIDKIRHSETKDESFTGFTFTWRK